MRNAGCVSAAVSTVRQARFQMTVVLFFSVVYNIPKFGEAYLEWDSTTIANSTVLMPKHTELGQNRLYLIVYGNICYVIFIFVLPLVALTMLNILLIRTLKSIRRRRAEMQSARQQQDNNITLVLIVVIIVFTICQTPALATQIFWNILDDDQRLCGGFQYYYRHVSNLLVIANSSVNFVIYLLFNTRFRQVLRQSVLCGAGGGWENGSSACGALTMGPDGYAAVKSGTSSSCSTRVTAVSVAGKTVQPPYELVLQSNEITTI